MPSHTRTKAARPGSATRRTSSKPTKKGTQEPRPDDHVECGPAWPDDNEIREALAGAKPGSREHRILALASRRSWLQSLLAEVEALLDDDLDAMRAGLSPREWRLDDLEPATAKRLTTAKAAARWINVTAGHVEARRHLLEAVKLLAAGQHSDPQRPDRFEQGIGLALHNVLVLFPQDNPHSLRDDMLLAAVENGVDRLELCREAKVGGLAKYAPEDRRRQKAEKNALLALRVALCEARKRRPKSQ